ncbi:hypothetical protein MKW98_017741 [Papaver atlanticum]|uniref:Uncharacterized protein n=1 Tax=Papaver atlanticum TaxID=357466 RepID=A0AAD4XWF5_9MAGN|nr:hypothetical protein MKW98_017741 [Papaver atlanticum]
MPQTERIPTIDLLPFFSNNEFDSNDAKKKKIKGVIDQACSQYGFFQIVNHGVSAGLMSQALNLSKTFFDLPDEEKLKYSPVPGAPLPSGYSRQVNPTAGQNEYLLMFTPKSSFKNIYPDNPPEFREVLQEDDVGGLEVLKDGGWIPVVPIEGSIIVNISDVIQGAEQQQVQECNT